MSPNDLPRIDVDKENLPRKGYRKDLENTLYSVKNLYAQGEFKGSKDEVEYLENYIKEAKEYQNIALSEYEKLEREVRIKDKRGYEVEDTKAILDEAEKALLDMDFARVFALIEEGWNELERILFKPFPLLEKEVTIETVIENDTGRIELLMDVINRMDQTLGKLVVEVSTPFGFKDLPEEELGVVGPNQIKSFETLLSPQELEEENHTTEKRELKDLLMENKIILRSTLDCSYEYPKYKISLKNTSEKPLKTIEVKPFIPEPLKADKDSKTIKWLEPADIATVRFELFPKTYEEETSIPEEEVKEEVKEEEEFFKEGSNYLLLGGGVEHSYSIFSDYFSEQAEALVLSTTIPHKIGGEFGVEVAREDLIWLTNIESDIFQVISPKDIHKELISEIEDFVENNEPGVIFIDKLERMKLENGFESTLEFLEKAWQKASLPDITLLVHVNPEAFSEEELERFKEQLDLYEVD